MLIDTIAQDQTSALKNHAEETLATLRLLLSEIKNKQIELQKELSDEEVVSVIRRQVKQLTDSRDMFEKGGRNDLVAENTSQIEILKKYLPSELGDDELVAEIERIMRENAETIAKNTNAVFGIVIGQLKSKADTSRITKILKEKLGT